MNKNEKLGLLAQAGLLYHQIDLMTLLMIAAAEAVARCRGKGPKTVTARATKVLKALISTYSTPYIRSQFLRQRSCALVKRSEIIGAVMERCKDRVGAFAAMEMKNESAHS